MRLLALLTAVLFAEAAIAAPVPKEKGVKDEEAIIGTWKVEKYDTGVPENPAIDLTKMRMTFKKDGEMVVVDSAGQEITRGYKLDPSAKPKAIDVTDGGVKALALYELDGDTLKYCLQFGKDAPRPTEVKADKEQGVYIITLKRVKDEKKEEKKDK